MSEVEPTITLLIIPLIQSFCMSKRILLFLHKHITHTHTHTHTHLRTHKHTCTHTRINTYKQICCKILWEDFMMSLWKSISELPEQFQFLPMSNQAFTLSFRIMQMGMLSCSVMSDSLWLHGQYIVHQPPLSMGFPRTEYWSGLPFPTSGESSRPRDRTQISHYLLHWKLDSLPLSHLRSPFRVMEDLKLL